MNKPLSTAQLRVLKLAESNPEHQYNGRIRRTAEILEKRGLITYDWRPYLQSGFDKVGQVWSIHITDGGREWLAKAGGDE